MFKDISFKISDVLFTEKGYGDNQFFKCTGIAVIQKAEEKVEYIPFSGQDPVKIVSKEKAISELYERLTWINIYINSRIKGHYDTIGFAAHTNLDLSLKNSMLEVIERYLFQSTVNNIMSTNNLKLEIYREGVTYSYEVNLNQKIHYISIYITISHDMIVFGMGKNEDLSSAKFSAYQESNLVDEAFNNRKVIKSDNLSYLELVKFLEISLKLNKYRYEVFSDSSNIGLNIFKDYGALYGYKLFDVTNLRPTSLPNKRFITCFVNDERIFNTILEKGGIEHATKI